MPSQVTVIPSIPGNFSVYSRKPTSLTSVTNKQIWWRMATVWCKYNMRMVKFTFIECLKISRHNCKIVSYNLQHKSHKNQWFNHKVTPESSGCQCTQDKLITLYDVIIIHLFHLPILHRRGLRDLTPGPQSIMEKKVISSLRMMIQ